MSFAENTLWHFYCSVNLCTIGGGWMWSYVLLRIGVYLAVGQRGDFLDQQNWPGLLLSALMSKGTCWDPCWKHPTLKHCSTLMKCSWEKLLSWDRCRPPESLEQFLTYWRSYLMQAGYNCCTATAFLQRDECLRELDVLIKMFPD